MFALSTLGRILTTRFKIQDLYKYSVFKNVNCSGNETVVFVHSNVRLSFFPGTYSIFKLFLWFRVQQSMVDFGPIWRGKRCLIIGVFLTFGRSSMAASCSGGSQTDVQWEMFEHWWHLWLICYKDWLDEHCKRTGSQFLFKKLAKWNEKVTGKDLPENS